MFQPLELFVGLRYTRAKRRNHFISFISLISILGVALGVAALITVLSVMNGFEKELRERILGMASHAVVTGLDGKLSEWHEVDGRIRGTADVVGSAPFIQMEAMLTRGRQVSGALVRGVLPDHESRVSDVGEHMLHGSLDALEPGQFGIVIGRELALVLGVRIGDKITVVTPQAAVTPAGILPRLRRFTVVGVFEIGMYEYDRATSFIHLDDAARLFQMEDRVTGLRLKLSDLFDAPRLSRTLGRELGGGYWVRDWTQQHANFFRAVKTEKTVMFIILSLIVAVAAFNIVSTLVMVVTDKQSDIAILRTLGLAPGKVMLVFMIQGTIIGVMGTALGVLGGVSLASNIDVIVPAIEAAFNTRFIDPEVYYISELPSDLRIPDVTRIAGIAFLITIVATLYPAWRAAQTHPAQALRYE
jgi:lipoprotein-releasing system permease protein